MTPKHAEQQLRRVFTAYPSYRKWLAEVSNGTEANQTFDTWVGMLTPLHADDLRIVVDEIIAGRKSPKGSQYDTADMLPLVLRSRAQKRADDLAEAERMRQLRDEGTRGAMDYVTASPLGRVAVHLGQLSREGKISREENRRRMDELIEWADDGENMASRPDWFSDELLHDATKRVRQ